MIKETYILKVEDFKDLTINSWGGALQTLEAIEEKGKQEEFLAILNDILEMNEEEGHAWTETQLNDFIWFDTDYIEECLNIKLWEDE